MRLWSLHPGYLDTKGLTALWREGLLAQKVLLGDTNGYRHHPQLTRFRQTSNPLGAIATYLRHVANEAASRGYHFDTNKIVKRYYRKTIPVTDGQLQYEFVHLLTKLKLRDNECYLQLRHTPAIKLHPSFHKIRGVIEPWERVESHTP